MKVLVVDDSPVDRRLAGRLIEKHGLEVCYANDGEEALGVIGSADIVVTDLLMPRMTGLELVETARKRFPAVPVILMTAHGSEDTAAAALRRGAASYVPKRALARELVTTITEVLALSRPERDEQRVYDGLVELEARFSIDNHPASLAPLVRHLETLLVRMGIGDETDCIQVAVALREALTNAIEHGNLELSSTLKDNGAYDAQAEERRARDPWRQRRVEVRVRMTREAVEYVVTDEGRGFDRALLPDPTDPANLERSHGRGLMLIGTFMDEVRHNDRGNVITMVKRRRSGEQNMG